MKHQHPVIVWGNPAPARKRKAKRPMAKKRKSSKKHGKKKNPSKGHRKGKKKNPSSRGGRQGIQKILMHGVSLGLGAVVAKAAVNNLPIPASLSGGLANTAVAGVVAFGLGWLAKKSKFTSAYADSVRNGGLAIAVYEAAAPTLLPMLALTDAAKQKAAAHAQSQNLLDNAKAAIDNANAMLTSGQAAAGQMALNAGQGDAFILSRGGISTRDRSPRDTAPLAGVGDAYAVERPGFSGAPNGLSAPWGNSIYSRR